MSFAYYNGTFGEYDDIRIPLSDRSIFFGDGVYDAAIGRNGHIYLEDEHITRLLSNAKRMHLPLKISRDNLSKIIKQAVRSSGLSEYFIYIQLSRYSKERTHSYKEHNECNLLITVRDFKLPPIDRRIKLMTHPDIRHSMCDMKTLNLLPNVLASKAAEERGFDEAVFHRGDTVTECAHSNISIIKNGVLYTHPTDNLILPGITRGRLLMNCDRLGVPYKEIPFSLSDLMLADEILITSTSKLCVPASQIGAITKETQKNSIGERLCMAIREDFFGSVEKNC